MIGTFYPYILHFKKASGTSRGILHSKETFFLEITDGGCKGIGECGLFRGLSSDDVPGYEDKLHWLCKNINADPFYIKDELRSFPSIWFGYEQAMLNLQNGADLYFPTEFTQGEASIKINGLIWMGNPEFMLQQIEEKLNQGFDCLKLKIGVNWNSELEILKHLREKFPAETLEIRVDANGGFSPEAAKKVLEDLASQQIHSIEQPIKPGNTEKMAWLCQETPTPIALDEELIGITDFNAKKELLEKIRPQYIILKPSLAGGFSGSDEWITAAEHLNTGWWVTSALESNIGLNAIAQYTYTKKSKLPQGLGTGALFNNNFETRLYLEGDLLKMKKSS